jgi:hypothetical protein
MSDFCGPNSVPGVRDTSIFHIPEENDRVVQVDREANKSQNNMVRTKAEVHKMCAIKNDREKMAN